MPSLLDQLTKQAENPLASSPTQPTPPVTFRDFGDANATRKLIFDNVLSAARKMPTVGNNRYQLSLHDVDYEDPDHISIKDQKSMMLRGETAHRRLRGTWKLHDALGNEIETRRMTLAQVPYMTQAGTFILNGTQNSLKHQMRLDPGAYTRIKETGSAETHANIRPGKGLSHRYNLEPSTGVFRMDFAQSSLPLVPILKAFGATDSELRGQWGNELFEANMRKDDPRVISKLYKRLVARGTAEDPEDKAKAVVEALQKMEFDPEVNRRTLGHPYANISKDAIFAISKKLLAVSRGEAEPDDRDHLAYQHVMGPEDLLAERLSRPGPLLHQLLWKASTKGSLKSMPVGAFDRHLRGAIQDSGLGLNDESVNPVEWLDQQHAITRLGKGGISSSEAVPDEARNVLPSHVGYIDLSKVPESSAAGVEGRIAYSVRKGSDGRLYAPYINAKTGKTEYKNPKDVTGMVLAFPGEMENKSPLAYALVDGRAKRVPKSKVELVLPHGEQWFSPASNMVALKHSSKGQRGSMGARFITQALPLTAPEAPLVQSAIPGSGGKSFDSLFGKDVGAVYAAKQGGRVKSVTPDEIVVKYNDGTTQTHELYNNFPNNRKTLAHNTPTVQEGDPVLPGQLIATSNYTDKNGTIALGLNLRTAYITWPSNFEDSIVISEEAGKRLASEHLYQHKLDFDPGQRRAKKDYVSIFANKYDKKTLANIDDHGFVRPGSVVKHGDPLILVAGERPLSHKTVHASHRGAYADRTLTWDHEEDGVVTDVAVTPKGATVAVKTIMPMRIGDKLSGRYGDKGIIGTIIPLEEMPRDPVTKEPYELLLNPLGIVTRGNPSQKHEAWLGKIAAKTGKPYILEDFQNRDNTEFVQQELDKHGMSGMENVEDPSTGRLINAATGVRYMMKLHHQAAAKGQGRGLGAYDMNDAPAKTGGESGSSKQVSMLDQYALLSHGATEVMRDIGLIRGQKNQEYWAARMAGFSPPTPNVPLVYKKFIDYLKGAGVNVTRKGSKIHLMALTDKHIDALAENREIKNSELIDWREGMKPVAHGFFDVALTGGHGGNKWSYLKLAEPLPNPVFIDPIRYTLRLTGKQFENILFGKEELHGKTGPIAIQDALKNINLKQSITTAREEIKSSRKMLREAAVRRLGYLKGLEAQGLEPKDWIISKVPVIPPIFRPVSQMQTGQQLVSDANYLLKEVFDANENLKNLRGKTSDLSEERAALFNSFKALTGLGDPIQPKNQERGVTGLLSQVFSDRPKFSTLQRKLIGSTVDLVGRAVVGPNPDLSMDEVGIPEARAWEVYSPFLVRRLVRQGIGRVRALDHVEAKDAVARKAMIAEMDERPVMINRAPILHRFGRMAFFPRLIKGDVMQVSPLVNKGFNLDADGDMMNYEVIADDDAAKEALYKMLPSRNLIAVSDFKKPMHQPTNEYLSGLFQATSEYNKEKRPRQYASRAAALAAWERGEMHPGDPIEILNE